MPHSSSVTLASAKGPGNGADCQWVGGKGSFVAQSPLWSGGSAKLQFQGPLGSYIDYPSGSLSADGIIAFELPACIIRVVTATTASVSAVAARTN